MFTSTDLKQVIAKARPIVERQLDDATQIASFRETVTTKGGDWSQVKALVKAMIQDEREGKGDGKRVRAILEKAENATAYADMLGLGNLNEKNSFAGTLGTVEGFEPHDDFDPETGEIVDTNSAPDVAPQDQVGGPAEEQTHSSDAGSSAPNSHPVANVGEEANGSIAAASIDPASREDETDHPRHHSTSGLTGEGEAAPAVLPTNSNVTAFPKLKMNPEFFEPPHPACLRPKFCGGNSNLALCEDCKVAAGLGIAVEVRGVIGQ